VGKRQQSARAGKLKAYAAKRRKSMNTYYIDYTIPEQTGTVKVEAKDAEEAGELFQKYSMNKLFNRAEGEEPVMEAMREFTQEQLDSLVTKDDGTVEGREIDVTLLKAY
jgi:hypothetical protein